MKTTIEKNSGHNIKKLKAKTKAKTKTSQLIKSILLDDDDQLQEKNPKNLEFKKAKAKTKTSH